MSRRGILSGAAGVLGASALIPASAAPPSIGLLPGQSLRDRLQADLETYAGFGSKLSGSPGDRESARWMGDRLSQQGFSVKEADFDVPTFDRTVAELRLPGKKLAVAPQPIVVTTSASGITAPIAPVRDLSEAPGVTGKLALIVLPYARHAALFTGYSKAYLDAVIRHKPAAIVIVTTGPTESIIALNAKLQPAAEVPIALLAPRDLPSVMEAAVKGENATLVVTGTSATGQSCNIIATRKAGPKWLAFSTPRSGWGICAGERGPGVAAFLELCGWAAVRFAGYSIFAISSGGHELDFIGTHHAMNEGPPPADTQIWTHLGAGLATRDAFEVLSRNGQLLSSADPQRAMMASHSVIDDVTRAFRGQPGYEMPIEVISGAGELSSIIARGYTNAFAGLGIHRWCHVADDTIDKVDADLLMPVLEGHKAVIEAVTSRLT